MKILGVSGRKQAGKNSGANFILGFEMTSVGLCSGYAMTDKGEVLVNDIFGDTQHAGIFDNFNPHPNAIAWMETHLWPVVKIYSFADLLKKNVCMDILGLSYEQCYGTDEQKNAPTKLMWENMPMPQSIAKSTPLRKAFMEKSGFLTGRDVLQYVGTEVFRRMYESVWAEATLAKIQRDDSMFAIICDVRFPNEVETIQKAGGKVIRLTKFSDVPATHESETALDKTNYDWTKFDAVVDNEKMDIPQQNKAIFDILTEWKWIL